MKLLVLGVLLLVNFFSVFKYLFVEMGFLYVNLFFCESGVMFFGLKKGECVNFLVLMFFDV